MPQNQPFWPALGESLFRREVKTPLAFNTRMIWAVIALIVAPLYSDIPWPWKAGFLIGGIIILLCLFSWVNYFAWKNPRYLLYSAESYLEERKMELGTEAKTVTAEEVRDMEKVEKPQLIGD